MDAREFWLWLHVTFAIVAFGPTFAFPFLGRMAQKEPMHGNFVLRATEFIGTRLIGTMAILLLATGIVLIFVGDWDLLDNEWLLIAIGLYAVAFVFSFAVQARTGQRLIELTRQPFQGPPPAEFVALTRRLSLGGAFLGLLVVAMVLLMVAKPGAA